MVAFMMWRRGFVGMNGGSYIPPLCVLIRCRGRAIIFVFFMQRWKTVQLMGIMDRLYSERLGLVCHIVAGEEAWTAWNGRAVMFTRARARLIEVDFEIFVSTASQLGQT